MELARISDHLICNSVVGVDSGAFTGFLYVMQYRELIYEIYEEVCGSRLTTNMGRIGGFERNFTNTAFERLEKFLAEYPGVLKEFENLLSRNRIFMERTIGAGPIAAERALNYGFTGPNLRAAGVDYDVRVHTPYSSYEDFEFTIPVGKTGDCYDRFLVRNQEMWQSLHIIKQAYRKVKEFKGADADVYHADAPAYYLPEKKDVYTKNGGADLAFQKIVMGETDIPPGGSISGRGGRQGGIGLLSDQRWGTSAIPSAFPSTLFYLLPGLFRVDQGGDVERCRDCHELAEFDRGGDGCVAGQSITDIQILKKDDKILRRKIKKGYGDHRTLS